MSTNYFAPPTLAPPRTITNPAADIAVPTLGPPVPVDPRYGALTGMDNYPVRAGLMDQLSDTGATSIYQRYMAMIRDKRDKTAAELSGYGGLSFNADDPATTNKDEGLTVRYETDRVGEKERAAYDEALAASLSRGGVGRAQLIGAGLQRVSQEAQNVIAQYASSITNAERTGYADQMRRDQDAVVARWSELYGADIAQFLKSQMPTVSDVAAKPTGPDTARPDQIVAGGGQVSPSNEFVKGKTVYNGKGRPNTAAYRNRFKASDGYVVQEFPPDRKGGNYRVVITFLYNPASKGSPGVNAGRAGLLPGTPAGDTTRPNSLPKPAPKPKPKPKGRGK